jgi:hypothetical protein
MLRNSQTDLGRAIHDNPVEKLKKAEAERRADPSSPKNKMLTRHDAEKRELAQRIVSESRKLDHEQTVARGKVKMLSGVPEHRDFEPSLKREKDELAKKHQKLRSALAEKHERELARLPQSR